MLSNKLYLFPLFVLVLLAFAYIPAAAQARPETDPRFEKLAKDLYPKAKQEGALVVYTVWDCWPPSAKGFPASMGPTGKRRDRKSRPEPSPNTREISRL
jgi:hypothetical protein